jgi:hypothetical protein
MDKKLHILQHSLGLDQYGHGNQYRNHFVTGPGSDDFSDCMALVESGLMKRHNPREIYGGDYCFTVTSAGIDYVALNSPAPPPQPKLTRSQKRYREYLAADWYSDSFAEWLGIRTRRA